MAGEYAASAGWVVGVFIIVEYLVLQLEDERLGVSSEIVPIHAGTIS